VSKSFSEENIRTPDDLFSPHNNKVSYPLSSLKGSQSVFPFKNCIRLSLTKFFLKTEEEEEEEEGFNLLLKDIPVFQLNYPFL
jgi:hypothetical protein